MKLIIAPTGLGKTNFLLNSVQRDNNIIDKIYLHAKDLEEPKYQLLIKKVEKAGITMLKTLKIGLLIKLIDHLK